jgi:serine palmitoyltransferase
LGKEDAVVFNMGFGTNATGIPALAGKGTLIVSDALNHSSIVAGARASGATVRVFKHNDPGSLEGVLRNAIVEGQPRTHRPWRKIVVMIEGIYSMEGEIVDLPGIVAVAKQYRAYIYLDEAHSIGCLGKTGRGVCEHTGVPTSDIDIMMGTFTKSFGAMGGYIAGSKALVDHIRTHSAGTLYSNALSPVVTAQVLRAFRVILDEDGSGVGPAKLAAAKSNSNYFRQKLMDMGLEVYGDWDSPVIPVMLYNPAKIAAFGRECLKVGLAVVVVGFPATPLISSRARFCISAGHTKETMDSALERIEKVCEVMKLKYNKRVTG